MKLLGKENIENVLQALDRQIGVTGNNRISLLVCGGSALLATGLNDRTTKDVDAIGIVEKVGDKQLLRKMPEFPVWLQQAIEKVGDEFGLGKHWLNLGPASQLDTGMPEGFMDRVKIEMYGVHLSVFYIGRYDQIHFKLYAALDNGPRSYHYSDLMKLKPSKQEITAAAKWVVTQDVSEPFRENLKAFLREHKYENIIEEI